MRKLSIILLTIMLIGSFPVISHAAPSIRNSAPVSTPLEAAEANSLLLRLDEIKSMDKSEMKSTEKKALRKEVKSIRTRLSTGGGVYLSVGALILIVLLLILVF